MNRASQKTTDITPPAPAAEQARRPASGPTLIDPQLLKHIAGGAPKGGWAVSPLSTTTESAPKGGW